MLIVLLIIARFGKEGREGSERQGRWPWGRAWQGVGSFRQRASVPCDALHTPCRQVNRWTDSALVPRQNIAGTSLVPMALGAREWIDA